MFGKRKQPPQGNSAVLPLPARYISPDRTRQALQIPERRRVELRPSIAVTEASTHAQELSSFVFFELLPDIDGAALMEAARSRWPAFPALTAVAVNNGGIAFADTTGKTVATLTLADSAIDDANAATRIAHSAHVLISVMLADPARAHMMLSALTTGLVETTRAAGVLWRNTGSVMERKTYLERARTTDGPPALLWFTVKTQFAVTASDSESVLAYTDGLASLGLSEYECVCTKEDLTTFADAFLYSRAEEAIMRGGQEPDGAVREFRVEAMARPHLATFRHAVSLRDDGGDVIVAHINRG